LVTKGVGGRTSVLVERSMVSGRGTEGRVEAGECDFVCLLLRVRSALTCWTRPAEAYVCMFCSGEGWNNITEVGKGHYFINRCDQTFGSLRYVRTFGDPHGDGPWSWAKGTKRSDPKWGQGRTNGESKNTDRVGGYS